MTEHPTGPLLRSDDYDAAPDDEFRAFLFLEEIARERMYAVYDEDQNGSRYYPLRGEYMTRVAGLAAAYGVPGIVFDPDAKLDNEFYTFIKDVDFQTTQINAGLSRQKRKTTLDLESTEKAKIRRCLNQIKKLIDEADISERRRRALLSRIADFETELERTKSNFAAMAAVSLILLAAGADLKTIGVDIDAPLRAVVDLLGHSRLKEDEELPLQIAPPLKLIEPPKPPEPQSRKGWDTLGDDIPF